MGNSALRPEQQRHKKRGHAQQQPDELGEDGRSYATCTFEPKASQVALARRFASATLDRWGLEADDLSLLVSELATNAVIHARSDFCIRLIAHDERVLVEVTDQNSRLPSLAVVPDDAYSGRGLMMVQASAAAWGVEAHSDDGKTIWFEVTCTVKV